MDNSQISKAEWEVVESDWMVFIDGVTQAAYEYNRKTGEIRSYDYDKAMSEMFENTGETGK